MPLSSIRNSYSVAQFDRKKCIPKYILISSNEIFMLKVLQDFLLSMFIKGSVNSFQSQVNNLMLNILVKFLLLLNKDIFIFDKVVWNKCSWWHFCIQEKCCHYKRMHDQDFCQYKCLVFNIYMFCIFQITSINSGVKSLLYSKEAN